MAKKLDREEAVDRIDDYACQLQAIADDLRDNSAFLRDSKAWAKRIQAVAEEMEAFANEKGQQL